MGIHRIPYAAIRLYDFRVPEHKKGQKNYGRNILLTVYYSVDGNGVLLNKIRGKC